MDGNRFGANRTQHAGGGQAASSSSHAHMGVPSVPSKVMVVSVILASLAIFISLVAGAFGGLFGGDGDVNGDQYQALFLTNGQVYFGKLSNTNDAYVELRDIYYLQVTQNELQEGENNASADPQISLAKLGNELHGPEDTMFVSRDQVLFWENLKTDSQVVTAINEFEANPDSQ